MSVARVRKKVSLQDRSEIMIVSSGYRKNGFDAHGGKILRKSDMSFWMNLPQRTDPKGVCLELGEEVEEVEQDFFELLPTISELWILNKDCRLYMTDKTMKLFKDNNVLLRGRFDTFAERFAREQKLTFLHLDTELARVEDYNERGIDIITLRFYDEGSAYIHQDYRCAGSSAGSVGGGETSFDLPKDFYLTMSDKDIAGQCWGSCYDDILEKGVLRQLIKKAKNKKGFLLDFAQG